MKVDNRLVTSCERIDAEFLHHANTFTVYDGEHRKVIATFPRLLQAWTFYIRNCAARGIVYGFKKINDKVWDKEVPINIRLLKVYGQLYADGAILDEARKIVEIQPKEIIMAKTATKKKATPVAKKPARVKKPRLTVVSTGRLTLASSGERVITLIQKENPKRPHGSAYKNYALYKDGMTVKEFIKAGGSFGDIRYDLEKGYISLSPVVKATAEKQE